MTWLGFIVASLATFRFTRLLTDDKITDWLRWKIVKTVPVKAKAKTKQGVTCPFCVSGWIALLFAVYLAWLGLEYEMFPFVWGGIWGGSVLWNQLFVKLSG